MTIFEQLRDIIATTLKVPVEKITDSTKDEDLAAWDSLGHVNLMMALEQTFDILIEVEDFPTLNSVQGIVRYLAEHGIE
ncbi:MAG: acyl carrier protein [Candidatus Competibacteraceae bacterium]